MKAQHLQRSVDPTLDRLLATVPAFASDKPERRRQNRNMFSSPRTVFPRTPVQRARAMADPGLAARLLGMTTGHLRTGKGDHEVDLIMEDREGRIMAFEIKLSGTVDAADARHLNWLESKIPPEDFAGKVIITAGQTAYPLPNGTLVLPLGSIGP